MIYFTLKILTALFFSDYPGITKIIALDGFVIDSQGSGVFKDITTVKDIDLTNAKITDTRLNNMFSGCSSLESVKFPSDYTAEKVEQMSN